MVVYVLPVPTFFTLSAPTLAELAAILGPLCIFLVVVFGGDLRGRSTCEKCGEPYALHNEGTYYHHNAKNSTTEKVGGEEYSYNEYDGTMLLRCTNKKCREYDLRDTDWTDKPLRHRLGWY